MSTLPIISGRDLVRARGATGSLPASVSVCILVLGTGSAVTGRNNAGRVGSAAEVNPGDGPGGVTMCSPVGHSGACPWVTRPARPAWRAAWRWTSPFALADAPERTRKTHPDTF